MQRPAERNLARRIVRLVCRELAPEGFKLTKPTFACRPGQFATAFFHFHKFSFAPAFRIHVGIRVMSDPFEAIALNGPWDEHAGRFSEHEEDIRACVVAMVRYCYEQGLDWIDRWNDPWKLLRAPDSPLGARERDALVDLLEGRPNQKWISQSERLLGLRDVH